MMLDSLITHADTAGAPNVVGRYRLLRVCPDPVADEWFNVGIYFEAADGSRDYRLLENMEAFKCLYGAHGVGNLNNLLSVVADAAKAGRLNELGPHIRAGQEHYAAGESTDEILSQMFDTFVTLSRRQVEEAEPKERTEGLNTVDLRKIVLGEVKSKYRGLYNRSFHDKPISLADPVNDEKREYDLPIFRQPKLGNDTTRFASIISAFVKTDINRAYHLDRGALTLLNARDVLKQKGRSEGAFFILRPHEGAPGFDEQVMRKIDDDIDTAIFHFRHDKHFHFEVFDDPRILTEYAIDYAS
ncbi:MAG: hypothetical protein CMG91_04880 [Marinobacter sp.]|nr:hypothetical protein [Marinobacter sp.]MBI46790.1 hypothetical protein [Marinobacter sp.]|tara:strand:+ start:1618 stop:2517 length:900 start_codon:yes stop_codon:yes gene_type:complete